MKHNRNLCQGKIYFGEEITGIKVTNPKTVQGPTLDQDVGFRDNYFSMVVTNMYPVIRPMISYWAKKVKNCQHLSSFPAVCYLICLLSLLHKLLLFYLNFHI
jgi:hypothetical protein